VSSPPPATCRRSWRAWPRSPGKRSIAPEDTAARRPLRSPPADEVEQAIVAVAEANPTDGYRMVWALVRRKLGRAVNRKRVLRVMRVMRERIQRRTHEPRGAGRASSASSVPASSGIST
jgi:hypothetical protein